jgi:hypothetical protein
MHRELCVVHQRIRFDRDATILLYNNTIAVPGADRCRCISCKNFAAQRNIAYPGEYLRLLSELGVDSSREWEAFDYDFGPGGPSKNLYGGWFLFCGELIEGVDERPKSTPADFAYWFTTFFPSGTLPKNVKIGATEFCTQIPWILSEMPG